MNRRALFTVAAGAAVPVRPSGTSLPAFPGGVPRTDGRTDRCGSTPTPAVTVAADHVHPESVVLSSLVQDALGALHYLTVMRLRELYGEYVEGMWEADSEHFEPQSEPERAAAEVAMVRESWWRATDLHGYAEAPFFRSREALALLQKVDTRLQGG